MAVAQALACPCGGRPSISNRHQAMPFADCCGRYLDDFENTPAPDAESLMRSRYSAYVLGRPAYLRSTWHASTRPGEVAADEGTRWLGLEVRGSTTIDADHVEVEFVARYRPAGVAGQAGPAASARAVRIHERSRFLREGGRWYYVDGDLL